MLMESQFEKLGAVIKSVKINAISVKYARDDISSDEDAFLLSKIAKVETEIRIATSEGLVLKSLAAVGVGTQSPDGQDDPLLVNLYSLQLNNAIEMKCLLELAARTAVESWGLKRLTESQSMFEEESTDPESEKHSDEILKLCALQGDLVQQLEKLSKLLLKQKERKPNNKKMVLKEVLNFSKALEAQRIQLANNAKSINDAKKELMEKIYGKVLKTNTIRMLMNILLTTGKVDLAEKREYVKLLALCREPILMQNL